MVTWYHAFPRFFTLGSNAESASLKKLFTDFDRDGDCLITLSRIFLLRQYVLPNDLSTIFEIMDKNMDQRIDFKEFLDVVVALEKKGLRTRKATATVGSTVQNTFEAFDKDKDGLVTLDEIRIHLLEVGKGASANELKHLFDKADNNSDGKIDINEFKELEELLRGKESPHNINPDLVKVFEQFDTDHDGLISKEEVRSTLRAIGKEISDPDLDSCFNESDSNKDGKIDITEFSNFIAKLKQVGKLQDMQE